jgi:hypothetical protein
MDFMETSGVGDAMPKQTPWSGQTKGGYQTDGQQTDDKQRPDDVVTHGYSTGKINTVSIWWCTG